MIVNAICRPGAEPNDQLSVVGNSGLTALFSPNDEQSRRIQDRITHLARQEKENLVLAETNKRLSNALVDDIKTRRILHLEVARVSFIIRTRDYMLIAEVSRAIEENEALRAGYRWSVERDAKHYPGPT
jgi:hypothetical protein